MMVVAMDLDQESISFNNRLWCLFSFFISNIMPRFIRRCWCDQW